MKMSSNLLLNIFIILYSFICPSLATSMSTNPGTSSTSTSTISNGTGSISTTTGNTPISSGDMPPNGNDSNNNSEIKPLEIDKDINSIIEPHSQTPFSNFVYYKLEIPNNTETTSRKFDLIFKVKSTKQLESSVYPKIFISKVSNHFK